MKMPFGNHASFKADIFMTVSYMLPVTARLLDIYGLRNEYEKDNINSISIISIISLGDLSISKNISFWKT